MSSRGAMTRAETSELVRCEGVIRRGLGTFLEVGQALQQIRAGKLYRDTHDSFEAYLNDTFPEMSRRRAYQLMDYAETAEVVNPGSQIDVPTERHARPLAGLPDEVAKTVWDVATGGGREVPTAARVAELAAKARPSVPAPALEELPAPRQRAAVREAEGRVCREMEKADQQDNLDALRRALDRVYERAVRYRPALAHDAAQAKAWQRNLVSLLRRAQAVAGKLT